MPRAHRRHPDQVVAAASAVLDHFPRDLPRAIREFNRQLVEAKAAIQRVAPERVFALRSEMRAEATGARATALA